jgi:hypothetical protein
MVLIGVLAFVVILVMEEQVAWIHLRYDIGSPVSVHTEEHEMVSTSDWQKQ